MKWKNLKDGRCPKCGSMLAQQANSRTLACSGSKCGYYISEQRMHEIISAPSRPRDREPEDNLTRHE